MHYRCVANSTEQVLLYEAKWWSLSVKKWYDFYWNKRFITVFTTEPHWNLSTAISIQPKPSQSTCLGRISMLHYYYRHYYTQHTALCHSLKTQSFSTTSKYLCTSTFRNVGTEFILWRGLMTNRFDYLRSCLNCKHLSRSVELDGKKIINHKQMKSQKETIVAQFEIRSCNSPQEIKESCGSRESGQSVGPNLSRFKLDASRMQMCSITAPSNCSETLCISQHTLARLILLRGTHIHIWRGSFLQKHEISKE